MSGEMTPEERLLQHIRKKPELPKDNSGDGKSKNTSKSVDVSKKQPKASSANLLSILGKILVLVSVAFAWYAVYEMLLGGRSAEQLKQSVQQYAQNNMIAQVFLVEPKPFEYYAQRIGNRDIFESILRQKKTNSQTTSSSPELTKNLNLVGIVIDENPEAIIEDTQSNQTLFLHVGDSINNAIIEEIQESKVILDYNGQRVELTQ